ncbi:hypothetical protein [Sinomicrobium sp.]
MKNTQAKTRLIFLALFAFTLFTTSCEKDEDDDPVSDDIVGTWELTDLTFDGYFEGLDELIPTIGSVKDLDSPLITFNSDGTVTGSGGTFTIVYAEKADETQRLEFPGNRFSGSGTWQRDGNTLQFGEGLFEELIDDSNSVNITALTTTKLQLGISIQHPGTDKVSTIELTFTRKG